MTDVEQLYDSLSYANPSRGDIERFKTVVNKYLQIDNGRAILTKSIEDYILQNKLIIEKANHKIEKLQEFLDIFPEIKDENYR